MNLNRLSRAAKRKNVLIVCSHFWPSLGGLESSMGQLGGELVKAGYTVTVMTMMFPGRSSDTHAGVKIDSIDPPLFADAIRAAVASGRFAVCILVQDPLGTVIWSVENLAPPPGTRIFIQPIINEDGYARWKDNADFSARLAAILKAAAAALVMTKSGPDTRYMKAAGIEHVYLPNATILTAPAGDFRTRYGIAPGRFLILHVANLYWVKNHVGLIDALPDLPKSWQLVMIGNASFGSDCVKAVKEKLAARPDILFIPGLAPEWVAAAMQASDVLVLASHGEGSPITILEAMSHGKPWLATPQCGAANDHLGGIIAELKEFKACLRVLAEFPALRQELARISQEHWRACYSWPVALRGWTDLIEHGRLRRRFEPEPELVAQMASARQLFDDARRAQLEQSVTATRAQAVASVIVMVDRRPERLERALRCICAQTAGALEIIVVNVSGHALEQVAEPFRRHANINYVVLNAKSLPGSRNAALRLASGKYVAFLEEMDEFLPDHLAVLLAALAASPHRLAYSRAEYLIGDEGQRPQRLRPFADIDYSRELLLVGSFIPASTWICERALFTEAGFFDESLERLDDWEWLLRASQLGAFLSVPAVTVLHQVGNDGGDQGREWFDRVYAKHPASAPELAAMRAQHLRQQFPAEHDAAPDDRAAALAEEFLSAARQGGLDVGALFEAAGSLTQGGRLDLAIGLYQGWLRHTESPLRYAVCYNLGTMFETDAQYGAAEQAYRDALGANPGFGPARMRLARQLERRADLSEAHAHWGWLAAPENGVAASDPQLHAEASGALRRFSAQIKKDIP